MNKGLITLSVEAMPGLYTEKEAIKLAKDAGADGVDFSLLSRGLYNSAVPDSIYAKSDEELYEHFKDLGDYASYNSHECPMCKKGEKIDALVNSFGFSKL